MKNLLHLIPVLALSAGISCFEPGFPSPVYAEVEIDLADEETLPTPTPLLPTPTLVIQIDTEPEVYEEAATPTATPMIVPVAQPKPAPIVKPKPSPNQRVLGRLKMRDIYEAGVKAYRREDYTQAIRYFKRALAMKDAYTKDYYYAEANAMLGVVYQFYFTVPGHKTTAYRYYKEALRIDPSTETARKYINQVRPK